MRKTSRDILNSKNIKKLTHVTSLDYFTARAAEEAGIDIIGLGGTAVEMFFKGKENGSASTMEELLFCLGAVRRGAPNTYIMASIPYGLSFISDEETLRNAVKLIKCGADATKIQGGGYKIEKIKKITREGIPCSGHLGLTTMYASSLGGFKSVGKKANEAIKLYKDALKLQEAGVVWIELECVPYKVADEITKRLEIPTIGVGSGPGCNGQLLVIEDLLGMHDRYYPKHCKKYLDFYNDSVKAFKEFKKDVEEGIFPTPDNSFEIDSKEYEIFLEGIDKII
ncbi:MAG: 3-methyl-2-oxobutanoate hydroxymethyltransferase [Actinobacteria bacterium]|nr:3-methyl-2-oxobutanoate hydroxymethyltransferase [Actinomycetota bacterium]